jgi:hypothetical protein
MVPVRWTGGRAVRAHWILIVVVTAIGFACNPIAGPHEGSGEPAPAPGGGAGGGGGGTGGGPSGGGGGGTGGGGGGSTGGGTADAIIAQRCTWCHTARHPAAGIDLQAGVGSAQLDAFGRGVQLELAPFVERLGAADKRTLLDWVRARGGAVPPVPAIPARTTWRLADVIADLPDGAPAPGFAFVVEDAFVDTRGWTVATFTDKHGRTCRGVALAQEHSVDQSVFSSSRNPSSYLVFGDLPWHGRFYDTRIEGDVRVGRWMSVGMAARRLSPTGRSQRDYVRLQFDRDAISLRSAPTPLETWPWGERADPRLRGTTDAAGFYQTASEWLHFVFESRRESGGVRWTARVVNPATGRVMADLSAFETTSTPPAGTFFLHAYSTGDKRGWANLVVTTSIDPRD